MTEQDDRGTAATDPSRADLKLEVVVIPVADVDRSKQFYDGLGWRLDADFAFDNGFRVVQFTPPGSPASVQFGERMTTAAPGSAQNSYLVVSDIDSARESLVSHGVEVTPVFHPGAPGAQFGDAADHADGRSPDSYSTFAAFSDPDGNRWLMQEVTTRLPGRIDTGDTSYASAAELADALRRVAAAHGDHEKRTGAADPDWASWYATYLVAEQAGTALPV